MTRKMMLIAGVAGLALTSPVAAKPDHQRERPQRAQQVKADRGQNARQTARVRQEPRQRAQRASVERRADRATAVRTQRVERAQQRRVAQANMRQERATAKRSAIRDRAVRRMETKQAHVRADRQHDRRVLAARTERRHVAAERRHAVAEKALDRRLAIRDQRNDRRIALRTPQGLPHRLGVHDMRVMKPAKLAERVRIGDRAKLSSLSAVPLRYRTRYADTPNYYYRYNNDLGYMYRIDRRNDVISGLVPLFGGYGIGDPIPTMYRSSYVPLAYQPYYYDTPDYYYRYDGNAIYRVSAETQLISGIVALLTGNRMGVGQMLPSSYNVYNVPMAYRSNYYDTPDNWYRYGDGYIYQVDPYSRRISASYPLYGGYDDYVIGQQWPAAYPSYNVPYPYRDTYYDTPQYQYRYANGAIYQVDPTTQLISAIAALVTGQPLSVGQPMPSQYGVYNVPTAYRDRYYDTPNNWYRYADGYVYQVNPSNGLISASYPIYG